MIDNKASRTWSLFILEISAPTAMASDSSDLFIRVPFLRIALSEILSNFCISLQTIFEIFSKLKTIYSMSKDMMNINAYSFRLNK
jgi:hypothetical protein